MQWSPQQEKALNDIRAWLKDSSRQIYRLFGYAGTGKTTLAKAIAELVSGIVMFGSFTGKAALVMQKNGCTGAQTLHSMLYTPEERDHGEVHFVLSDNSPVKSAGLIIVDEVSMVDDELAADLLSFGKKVLVLGDPFQLPPVRGTGYFINQKPDTMLTEIRRQALDNPIVYLSMRIREGDALNYGIYGDSQILRRDEIDSDTVLSADQVLVGRNRTRQIYNTRLRHLKGLDGALPHAGERLICLRNNRDKGLLNGSMWTLDEAEFDKSPVPFPSGAVLGVVSSLDTPDTAPVPVTIPREFFDGDPKSLDWRTRKFADEFDYGYVITTHKSQGSQWQHVVVFDESSAFREHAGRWLYTAITRSEEKLTLIQ